MKIVLYKIGSFYTDRDRHVHDGLWWSYPRFSKLPLGHRGQLSPMSAAVCQHWPNVGLTSAQGWPDVGPTFAQNSHGTWIGWMLSSVGYMKSSTLVISRCWHLRQRLKESSPKPGKCCTSSSQWKIHNFCQLRFDRCCQICSEGKSFPRYMLVTSV